jgi:ABC-type nitrate/sulfonate/bicarbonate transport system substrate-binding protein
VSGAFLGEPFLSAGGDNVRVFAKAYDAIGNSFYICAWFASRDWLTRNADVARRLLGVVYETARWANANHDATAPILAKYMKLDVDRIRAMTRAQFATSFDPRMMQPILDVAYRYKQLERPVSASDIFTRV